MITFYPIIRLAIFLAMQVGYPPGCLSLHLILRLLQLKHPRRDFVCPFLGTGFLGSDGALSVRLSDRVGESLEELTGIL
jgi:hypothetical protein